MAEIVSSDSGTGTMGATKTKGTWQEELSQECQQRRLPDPVYDIVSERKGGRTAWTAKVAVEGQYIAARAWYDGQHLNNAKEDAAETVGTLKDASLD